MSFYFYLLLQVIKETINCGTHNDDTHEKSLKRNSRALQTYNASFEQTRCAESTQPDHIWRSTQRSQALFTVSDDDVQFLGCKERRSTFSPYIHVKSSVKDSDESQPLDLSYEAGYRRKKQPSIAIVQQSDTPSDKLSNSTFAQVPHGKNYFNHSQTSLFRPYSSVIYSTNAASPLQQSLVYTSFSTCDNQAACKEIKSKLHLQNVHDHSANSLSIGLQNCKKDSPDFSNPSFKCKNEKFAGLEISHVKDTEVEVLQRQQSPEISSTFTRAKRRKTNKDTIEVRPIPKLIDTTLTSKEYKKGTNETNDNKNTPDIPPKNVKTDWTSRDLAEPKAKQENISLVLRKQRLILGDSCGDDDEIIRTCIRKCTTYSRFFSDIELNDKGFLKIKYIMYAIAKANYLLSAPDLQSLAENAASEVKIENVKVVYLNSSHVRIFENSIQFVPKVAAPENLCQLLNADCEKFIINMDKAENPKDKQLFFVNFLEAHVLDRTDNGHYTLKPGLWKLQMYMPEVRPYLNHRLKMIHNEVNENNSSGDDYKIEVKHIRTLLTGFYMDHTKGGAEYVKSLKNTGIVHEYRKYILALLSTDKYKRTLEYRAYFFALGFSKQNANIGRQTIKQNLLYMLAFTPYVSQFEAFNYFADTEDTEREDLQHSEEIKKFNLAHNARMAMRDDQNLEGEDNEIEIEGEANHLLKPYWYFATVDKSLQMRYNRKMHGMFAHMVRDIRRLKIGNVKHNEELEIYMSKLHSTLVLMPKKDFNLIDILRLARFEVFYYFHNRVFEMYAGE